MKNNGNITTVLSLFDGISCARVALDRLGYTDVLYLASEVDKYASAITRHQWPDTIHLGDITQIKRENLPVQIDLLIGGSPCQDLSIAKNNRKGLDGERSGLFWEWVRLWRECQPRYWVLENVNSMPKEAKRIISETLGVEPIMINAALVSAQNRKRLFWTNIATDIFGHCHIPLPEDRGILLRDILESGTVQDEIKKSYCIDANYYKGGKKDTHNQSGKRLMVIDNIYPSGGQAGNVYDAEGKSPTLSTGTAPKMAEPVFVAGIGETDRIDDGIGEAEQIAVAKIIKMASDCGLETVGIIQTGHGHNSGGIKAADGKTPPLTTSAWEHNNKLIIPEARGVALRSRTCHDNHADKKYKKLPEISGEKANAMTSVQTDSMVAVAIPEATKKGYAIAVEGDSVDLSYPNSKTRRGRVSKKAPSQMTSSQSVGVLEGYTIRKLTPVECERLMTLPDQYTALGDFGDGEAKPISNTQRYKTLGNGFVVEVVAHILSYQQLQDNLEALRNDNLQYFQKE
jgi:DNA-cytosine methyltransferase